MLFDVYFNLGSFVVGLFTIGALEARMKGDNMIPAVAIGLAWFTLVTYGFRWHMRQHTAEKDWSLIRRLLPAFNYAAGVLFALYASGLLK